MTVNVIFFCASVLLVQQTSGQCMGSPYTSNLLGNPLITDGLGLVYDGITGVGVGGLGGMAPAAGGLAVTSMSPLAPTGVTVVSDKLTIEGPLAVGGQVPFMGSVAMDAAVGTGGQGGVSYSCGDGSLGISEGMAIMPSLSITGPVQDFTYSQASLPSCGLGVAI